MEPPENTNNKKKKNRTIPFIWFFGLGLTGGLVVLGILVSKKNDQLNSMKKELTETRTSLTSEKETLANKLEQVNGDYNSLKTENKTLNNNLNEQKVQINRLAGQNANFVQREQKLNNEYNALLASFELISRDHEILKGDIVSRNTELDALRSKLGNCENLSTEQGAFITRQSEKLKSDSAATAALRDSIRRETVTGFVNITELNGACGLKDISLPYSHYFYGLTTINGYRLNRHLQTGIGIGLSAYNGGTAVPLYLDFRYNFGKKAFKPYVFADGGMIFKLDDPGEPILFVNPGIGLYKSISERFALTLGTGLFIQRNENFKASFINVKAGLAFTKNGW